MGGSLTDTFSRGSANSDSNSWQNATGSSTPTFNSTQGQGILNSLTGQTQNPLTYNGQAGTTTATQGAAQAFGNAADTGSPLANYSQNPYITSILSSSDKLGGNLLNQGLAQTRAQDYGAGDVKSLNDQGTFASTFANQQALQDAQTALGQYNIAGSTAMQGASGLAGQSESQQNLAAQILAMLRGTSTTSATQGGAATNTSQTGNSITGSVNAGTKA